MKRTTLLGSLSLIFFTLFIKSGQTFCMKRDEKPEKLQPDFVVSTQLAQQLQEHIKLIKENRSDKDEKPETFEKSIEALASLFCSYKFHKGRLAFNDREVEIYDDKKKQWRIINDGAVQKFHTWFNDAVDKVCDSDPLIGKLISLASAQLSTINEENRACYCELLQQIPKSVAHRIKEEFVWSDNAFVIAPRSIDLEDNIERMHVKKGKLLVGFPNKLCVYDLHDYKLLYSFDKAKGAHCIEKYKKLIAVLYESGDLALYYKKTNDSAPLWMTSLGEFFIDDCKENSLQFINEEQIALALKTEIRIITIKDGKTVRSIPMYHEFHLYPQGYSVSNSSTIKYHSYENDQCIVTIEKGRLWAGGKKAKTKLLFLNDKILIVDSSSILQQFDLLGREAQIICFDYVYKLQPLDSLLVAIHTYDGLKVIDSASKKCLKEFPHHIYDFAVVDQSEFPERRLLTHQYGSTELSVWDLPTFEKVVAVRIEKNKSTNQG